jgi:hypothetical protein
MDDTTISAFSVRSTCYHVTGISPLLASAIPPPCRIKKGWRHPRIHPLYHPHYQLQNEYKTCYGINQIFGRIFLLFQLLTLYQAFSYLHSMEELQHHYPQTDELSKERLQQLIDKAKGASYDKKVELFALLEQELYNAADNGKGKDVKNILSEGFTAFEQRLKHRPDQEISEGFLHWNHLIFVKHYKQFNQPQQIAQLFAAALHESKYWLVTPKDNEGVLAKPKGQQ